jgi:hypothetical protein
LIIHVNPCRKEHPSHRDSCEDSHGNLVTFQAGMALTAFDEDADEHGNRDDVIATNQIYETICPWAGPVSDERRSRKPGFWPFPHSGQIIRKSLVFRVIEIGPSLGNESPKRRIPFPAFFSPGRGVIHPSFPLRGRWERPSQISKQAPSPSLGDSCRSSFGMRPLHYPMQLGAHSQSAIPHSIFPYFC